MLQIYIFLFSVLVNQVTIIKYCLCCIKKWEIKKSIQVHQGRLISALAALKYESNTGTMAIVSSVGDRERVLHKMSGNSLL